MLLKDYLKKHRVIMDGAMGTYYSSLINQPGAISELANISNPSLIEKIHKEYIEAGAKVLRTNTFAANRVVLQANEEEQKKLVNAACQIGKDVIKEYIEKGNSLWLLGDIGPIPENADSDENDILAEYQQICDIFIEEGLDGIHFETFSSLKYIEKLVPYIKEKKESMFILASFSFNKNGYTSAGISVNRLIKRIIEIEGIDGYGFNCGIGSGHMYQVMKKSSISNEKYLFAAPNAGYPEQMQNRLIFMDNEEYFTKNMLQITNLGVDLIGGCCGTNPNYIRKLVESVSSQKEPVKNKINKTDSSNEKMSVRKNDFYNLFDQGKKVIAVELDPPYNAEIDHLMECAHVLKNCGADIITFADSPMGRSRVDSILMSTKIATETGMLVMPHICCRDRNMISMRSSLLGAYIHGIRNLLLVTGDPVPGDSRVSTTGVFDYNSIQLMDFVNEINQEHFASDPFVYGGALNYGRGMIDKVIERMKRKIDAGAKYFLTQPIYSSEDVERIRMIKERVDTKILCGIMPLVSYRNACFIKNEITGINVPDSVVDRYRPDMTKEEAEDVGVAIAKDMMDQLETVADGYYFMIPFNRVSLIEKIVGRKQ